MPKLIVAVLALVLAGTASAAGWRSLRIDASSEASFAKSVEEFRDKLTPSRRVAFVRSLQDIRIHGSQLAVEEQREYTDADFLRQIHGLGYEQIVTLTDPTGDMAKDRYRVASLSQRYAGPSIPSPNWNGPLYDGKIEYPRGQTDLHGPTMPNNQ